jgi:hypothetical protein
MKRVCFVFIVAAGFIFCGCGSIVNSVRESKEPPMTGQVVSGIPYYLPAGKITVTGSWNKDTRLWDIKITPVIEADTSARYLVERHANILFDDDITISVDPNTGLLQTVNATSTDQSVNALAGLIGAAASALTFSAGLGPLPGAGGAVPLRAETEKEFAEIKSNAVFTTFQAVLRYNSGPTSSVYVVSPDLETNRLYAKFTFILSAADYDPSTRVAPNTKTNFPGILVRRLVPYSLTVKASIYNSDANPVGRFQTPPQIVMLPDQRHDYCLELSRAPLVSNTTKITLANGTVQTEQRVRPSVFMGIVGVPKTILSALCPIPLQIRNDQLNLLTAQDKTLAAEQDIKKLNKQP